ncbi:TPA: glycosyltransferase family 2 protein [Serratia fonticola]
MKNISLCKTSILVVLYNKNLSQSQTLLSLLEFDIKSCRLVILNNGPLALIDEPKFMSKIHEHFQDVVVHNELDNLPLSVAYNRFIEKHIESERYILLDDDSIVTSSFTEKINSDFEGVDLELPKIITEKDSKIHYPIYKLKPIEDKDMFALDPKKIVSIGSGLIISRRLVNKFKSKKTKLFDERFALYGVDYKFFCKLKELANFGVDIQVTSTTSIVHSLSRLEGKISKSRSNERLYDVALSARFYPSKLSLLYFCKDIIKNVIFMRFDKVSLILNTFYKGYHPRSKKYLNDARIL